MSTLGACAVITAALLTTAVGGGPGPAVAAAFTAAAFDTTGDVRTDEAERLRLKETLRLMGRSEVEGERQWQRRKSGRVAMLSSALLPGLGQVYNGRRVKVAVTVGFASAYAAQIWLNVKQAQRARSRRDRLEEGTSKWDLQNRLSEFHEDEARTWLWWSGAMWIIGILDAWTDAHLYDIRAYTPPPSEASGIPSPAPARYVALTFEF